MVTVENYKPQDFKEISPRLEDENYFKRYDLTGYLNSIIVNQQGDIKTVRVNGEIATIMAVARIHNQVGEVFQIPNNQNLKMNVKKVVRVLREEIREKLETYIRLYTYCQTDELHNRWMSYLGFKLEGTLIKHGLDGEDLNLWAKVR